MSFFRKVKAFFLFMFFVAAIGIGVFYFNDFQLNKKEQKLKAAIDQKDYNLIIEHFNKIKADEDLNSDQIHSFYLKAWALFHKGLKQESVPFWEKIAQTKKIDQRYKNEAYFHLSGLMFEAKDFDQSLKLYDQIQNQLFFDDQLIIDSVLLHAKLLDRIGEWDEAVDEIRQVLKKDLQVDENAFEKLMAECGRLNMKRITTRKITKNSIDYTILPGDTLSSIGEKFNTTIDLILKTNNLKSALIRPRNHLKINTIDFSIQISKNLNHLIVYENGEFFKKYKVGTGKYNVTPVGEFKVTSKQSNPTWYRHDGKVIPYGTKENLLGTRWMAIDYPGYGIHGTWEPETVGYQSSAGCIRMKNEDVEELFSYITINTPVVIQE